MDFGLNANHLLCGHASVERGQINPRFANPHLFAREGGDGGDDGDTPINAAPAGLSTEQLAAWTAYSKVPAQVFDYLYRGPAFKDASPAVMAMNFYLGEYKGLNPIDGCPLRLDFLHPQRLTHVWHRYQEVHPPQLLRDPPLAPDPDTSAADKEIYAAYVLGNFTPYDHSSVPVYGQLYSSLQQLLASTPEHYRNRQLLSRFERNMQSRAGVHARGHARMQRQREAAAAGDTAAAAAAVLHIDAAAAAEPEGAHPEPGDDDLYADAGAAAEEGEFDEAAILQQQAEDRDTDNQALLAAVQPQAGLPERLAIKSAFLVSDHQHQFTNEPFLRDALKTLGLASTSGALPPPDHPAAGPQPVIRSTADAGVNLPDVSSRLRALNAASAQADGGEQAGTRGTTLSLHRAQPSGDITLRLHILPDPTSAQCPEIREVPATEDPPYIRLPLGQRPSPEDVVRIFRLDPEQEQPLLALAYTLLAEHRGRGAQLPPPLMMLIPGAAGSGKSRAVVALAWLAYQHVASELLAIASYTWRGALQVSTPGNDGVTTTTLFGLGGRNKGQPSRDAMRKLQNHLAGKRMLIIDEAWFLGLPHLAGISTNARRACAALDPASPHLARPFAYLHCAMAGDPRQHVAPFATPLITGADVNENDTATLQSRMLAAIGSGGGHASAVKVAEAMRGYRIYHDFHDVFILRRQYRLEQDQQHLQNVMLFEGRKSASRETIQQFCFDLQRRALQRLPPQLTRAVVLRHSVQVYANRLLAKHHAMLLGEHVFIWRSKDTTKSLQPLPADVANRLDGESFKDTGGIPTINFFFRGCLYVFGDVDKRNSLPQLHVVSNNSATGVDLLLTPEDAAALQEEQPGQTIHVLRGQPEAIIVRPDGAPLPDVCGHPAIPAGCIPMVPITQQFTLKAHRGIPAVQVVRRGFDLQDAYAVTDFFAQGMSFRDIAAVWAAHLTPPPGSGSVHRPNIYVTLSRFSSMAAINLLGHLWPALTSEDQRAKVVDVFLRCAQCVPVIARELERLEALDAVTRRDFPGRLQIIKAIAGPP